MAQTRSTRRLASVAVPRARLYGPRVRRSAAFALVGLIGVPLVGWGPSLAEAGPEPWGAVVRSIAGSLGDRAAAIRRFANRWIGTPYQWGGTTRSGIDCSAYLREMYRELFGVELPRTTKQQIHLGVDLPVNPGKLSAGLEPGDLIFYVNAAGVPNHVVVYAGGEQITHSVSGRGVVFDPMKKLYGRRVVARRMLSPARRGGPSVGGGFAPIPAAGPLKVTEIPCPPEFRPRRSELTRWSRMPVANFDAFAQRDLCEVRLLADALEDRSEPVAKTNAGKLRQYAEWIESLDEANDALF